MKFEIHVEETTVDFDMLKKYIGKTITTITHEIMIPKIVHLVSVEA